MSFPCNTFGWVAQLSCPGKEELGGGRCDCSRTRPIRPSPFAYRGRSRVQARFANLFTCCAGTAGGRRDRATHPRQVREPHHKTTRQRRLPGCRAGIPPGPMLKSPNKPAEHYCEQRSSKSIRRCVSSY